MTVSGSRHFKASFDENGLMMVNIGGKDNGGYNPYPSGQSDKKVVDTMKSIGAVLISTQWFGWVPAANMCPSGGVDGLGGSVFKVSNLRVFGTVKQGTPPPVCSGPTPPAKPTAKTSSLHRLNNRMLSKQRRIKQRVERRGTQSGLTTSMVFTAVSGIELGNPDSLLKAKKTRYFNANDNFAVKKT